MTPLTPEKKMKKNQKRPTSSSSYGSNPTAHLHLSQTSNVFSGLDALSQASSLLLSQQDHPPKRPKTSRGHSKTSTNSTDTQTDTPKTRSIGIQVETLKDKKPKSKYLPQTCSVCGHLVKVVHTT